MRRSTGVALLLPILCACDAGTPTAGEGSVELRGQALKGPLIEGSTVLVSALDGAGNPTGDVFTTTTGTLGNFSVSLNAKRVNVEATGYYFNEVANGLSGAPLTLRAFVKIGNAPVQTTSINAMTHLAALRAKHLWLAGSTIPAARAQAETELLSQLGIGPAGLTPPSLASDATFQDGDTLASAYLFAVSAVLLQAAYNEQTGGSVDAKLQELMNGIALDLETDGVLDTATKLQIHDGEANLNADYAQTALEGRLTALGITTAAPRLARALDQDFDDVSNFDDCLPLDGTRWPGHADGDSDGHEAAECGGDDCNDGDPLLYPGVDLDGDGHSNASCGGDDCDDFDATVYPGADLDSDGHATSIGCGGGDDCSDSNSTIHPGASDTLGDGIDEDCDSVDGTDADHDGFPSIASGGTDCDDADPTVHDEWDARTIAHALSYSRIALAVDAVGDSHVFYADSTGVRHLEVGAMGPPSLDELVATDATVRFDATIDGSGVLHLVQPQASDLRVRSWSGVAGAWSSELIPESGALAEVTDIRVAASSAGALHVLMDRGATDRYTTNASGLWSTPLQITQDSTPYTILGGAVTDAGDFFACFAHANDRRLDCRSPTTTAFAYSADYSTLPYAAVQGAVIADGNTPHYFVQGDPEVPYFLPIRHVFDPGSGLVSEDALVPIDLNGMNNTSGVMDASGHFHLCTTTDHNTVMYATNESGTWTTRVIANGPPGFAPQGFCRIALDAAGNPRMAWLDFVSVDVRYVARNPSCG